MITDVRIDFGTYLYVAKRKLPPSDSIRVVAEIYEHIFFSVR